jgi:hypothetical protein
VFGKRPHPFWDDYGEWRLAELLLTGLWDDDDGVIRLSSGIERGGAAYRADLASLRTRMKERAVDGALSIILFSADGERQDAEFKQGRLLPVVQKKEGRRGVIVSFGYPEKGRIPATVDIQENFQYDVKDEAFYLIGEPFYHFHESVSQ